jgi:hypothetical protein
MEIVLYEKGIGYSLLKSKTKIFLLVGQAFQARFTFYQKTWFKTVSETSDHHFILRAYAVDSRL